MKLSAKKIASIINGKLVGEPDVMISSCAEIKNAKNGDITFLADMRYKKYIKECQASIIISPQMNIQTKATIIQVKDPAEKFAQILNMFYPEKIYPNQISEKAKIHKSVQIGKNVYIGENITIEENVIIGDNCIISANTFIGYDTIIKDHTKIGPNVTIYHKTNVGEHCTIHAGAIIGSDGFGFIERDQKLIKMPQVGKVIIKDNIEIGANTTIDRGTINNTIIHSGVKLDNLIQIGHNVIIGANTVIAAQTGIAGSTEIGQNCMIGGQVAIGNHLTIGNNVKIAGKSGVIKNIANNQIIQGPLAFNIKDFQKSYIHFKNLQNIVSDLQQLKQKKKIAKDNSK